MSGLKAARLLGEEGVNYAPYGPTSVDSRVLAILRDGQRVDSAMTGDKVELVLGQTPFYVEAGGQVSDIGTVSGESWIIEVEDMRRPIGGLIVHVGEVLEGTPREGDPARAEVDARRRAACPQSHGDAFAARRCAIIWEHTSNSAVRWWPRIGCASTLYMTRKCPMTS
jgi:alanyl-tRNA synthetase